MSYYQDELDRVIPTEYSILSIKIRRDEIDENLTFSTKLMSLNKDSIDVLIKFLEDFKQVLPD